MAHPIIGLWKTVVTFEDQEFMTVHNYSPDGVVVVDAGIFVATGIWQATGDRSVRTKSLRPIVTGTLMDREFHGWQEVEAAATVGEDDALVTETAYQAVDEEGQTRTGTVRSRGERVTIA